MTGVGRRAFVTSVIGIVAGALARASEDVEGGQRRPVVRHRRRVRRRVRRRIRRRVTTRMILGRRVWVAPLALAIGWELALAADSVVVVREVRFIERAGARVEVVVVQGADGKSEELEIVREDTPDNIKAVPGSVLPDSDKTTPFTEAEEDVEVDQ